MGKCERKKVRAYLCAFGLMKKDPVVALSLHRNVAVALPLRRFAAPSLCRSVALSLRRSIAMSLLLCRFVALRALLSRRHSPVLTFALSHFRTLSRCHSPSGTSSATMIAAIVSLMPAEIPSRTASPVRQPVHTSNHVTTTNPPIVRRIIVFISL